MKNSWKIFVVRESGRDKRKYALLIRLWPIEPILNSCFLAIHLLSLLSLSHVFCCVSRDPNGMPPNFPFFLMQIRAVIFFQLIIFALPCPSLLLRRFFSGHSHQNVFIFLFLFFVAGALQRSLS
jgi:hypothetical protein